jgi:hypothetical protein
MQKCKSKLSLEYKQLSLLTNLSDLVLNTNQEERETYTETVKGEVFDCELSYFFCSHKFHKIKKHLIFKRYRKRFESTDKRILVPYL